MNYYQKANEKGFIQAATGIARKTLVFGEKTLMTEFKLEKNATLLKHSHPEEQTGFLVSGHMILTIGSDSYEIQPGDSWIIPGNILHGAEVLEDSVALEVFSPVREDYLT